MIVGDNYLIWFSRLLKDTLDRLSEVGLLIVRGNYYADPSHNFKIRSEIIRSSCGAASPRTARMSRRRTTGSRLSPPGFPSVVFLRQ
jgi:hypothetical protein